MGEQLISRQILRRNIVGHFGNIFFELFYLVAVVLEQDELGDQEVEEFLFYF